MKDLKISLTVDETNKVLDALAQMPFVQVHQLIAKIHQSAQEQLQEERNFSEEKVKSIVNG